MSMGEFMKDDTEHAPDNVAFRFTPKTRHINLDSIYCELFEWGCEGNMYAIIVRIPDEFPADDHTFVDIYEPSDAAQICGQWERYTVVNSDGQVLVGDKDELLRKWGYEP